MLRSFRGPPHFRSTHTPRCQDGVRPGGLLWCLVKHSLNLQTNFQTQASLPTHDTAFVCSDDRVPERKNLSMRLSTVPQQPPAAYTYSPTAPSTSSTTNNTVCNKDAVCVSSSTQTVFPFSFFSRRACTATATHIQAHIHENTHTHAQPRMHNTPHHKATARQSSPA